MKTAGYIIQVSLKDIINLRLALKKLGDQAD